MGTPCIIYAVATILLAWIDAMRIKAKWGKAGNIDHVVSTALGVMTAYVDCYLTMWGHISVFWWALLWFALLSAAFVFIRLALFDIALNGFRLWTGTNPTGRIDYVSTTTSSYEDQHSEKVGFWMKRIIGVAGWAVMFLLYKVIFRV